MMEQELVLLEGPSSLMEVRVHHMPRSPRLSTAASRSCHKAPLKLCRLFLLLILLPSFFVLLPLYMRYRVYSGQMYPMSMTDMRLIDGKISPTWCQGQVVRSNATFNAFVVGGQPELSNELVPVSMSRQLELEDDMKEYWGFYLLQGSTVTVSACVRWPGASLIMIKGYKHLQECAYIGDDSSEELDELLEANKLGLLSNKTFLEKVQQLKKEEGKANDPETMKRRKGGVLFHDPSQSVNETTNENVPAEVTDHDPKELREILERLHALRQAQKDEMLRHYQPPAHLMSLPALHRHRDANVDREERQFLHFKDLENNTSENTAEEVFFQRTTTKAPITTKIPEKLTTARVVVESKTEHKSALKAVLPDAKEDEKSGREENFQPSIIKTTEAPIDHKQEESSKEVFEDVLKRLQALGDRGKKVLVKLHSTMGLKYDDKSSNASSSIMSAVRGKDEELDHLQQVIVEAMKEDETKAKRQEKRREAREEARAKRELLLGQVELQKQFNEDDEARDFAAEEDLEPDGYAEHHSTVNETTAFDMSNSEFWSSFSSSEEALLECAGLILNLPLTPSAHCTADNENWISGARANALTYRVPANGYYFFVFNSENEVQRNLIRARFDLQKTRYDVARSALRECRNKTDRCDLPLDLFSNQRVVLEVPLRNNDSLWNEQFVIISECEPRTSVYLVCAIAVPVLIIIFGFQ